MPHDYGHDTEQVSASRQPGEQWPETAHVGPLLEAFHAGALTPEQAAPVERHLRSCDACRLAASDVALDALIRAAPAPTAGPELRHAVYTRIAAASEPAGEHTRLRLLEDDAPSMERPHGHDGFPSRASASHPRRGWLSGAVALIVVSLLAGVFWESPHASQRGQITRRATTVCGASVTSAALPAHAFLNDITLTSPSEGWAVGAIQNDQGAATQGLIMRFSACHWTPFSIDLPNVHLKSISMDSPTDGWAAGDYGATQGIVLAHFSNGRWARFTAPAALATRMDVVALAMNSPDDGWLVTMGPDMIQETYVSAYAQTLFHYSHGVWSRVASPISMIDAIAPVGSNDLWIAGTDFTGVGKSTTHRFAHYQDSAWNVVAQPAGQWTDSLHVVSPTDIWASGYENDGKSVFAHYDGVSWQSAPQTLPVVLLSNAVILGDGQGWAYTLSANGTPTAAPPMARYHISTLSRESGGQWQSTNWRYTDISQITKWVPLSNGEVWAIGTYQVMQPPTPLPGGGSSMSSVIHTVLLHYVDGVWTRYG